MLKKKSEETLKKGKGSDGRANSDITALLTNIANQQQELMERIEELEKKKGASNSEALLHMVNFLYNTDDEHLPELTRIPIQAARPHALGMMLESLLDPEIQSGEVPLSRKLRNYYFRLMRSVGGVHLGRGVRLAEEQAASEAEKAEEIELGGED